MAKASANIIDTTKYDYDKTKFRDGEGKARFSKSNGDAVAQALLGADRDALIAVVKANGLEAKFKELVKHDDTGVFRMSLGNSLRAMVRKGTGVKVRGHSITKLDQKVTLARGIEVEDFKSGTRSTARRAPKAAKVAKAKKPRKAKTKAAA